MSRGGIAHLQFASINEDSQQETVKRVLWDPVRQLASTQLTSNFNFWCWQLDIEEEGEELGSDGPLDFEKED